MTNTQEALRFSVINFVKQATVEGRKLYFMTVTMPDTPSTKEFSRRWTNLCRKLQRKGVRGIRVYEPHPGGHGLHIHFLTDVRIDWGWFWEAAEKCGCGRVDGQQCDIDASTPERLGGYLAKYLGKQFRCKQYRGLRRWACFGWKGTRVSAIKVTSPAIECFQAVKAYLADLPPGTPPPDALDYLHALGGGEIDLIRLARFLKDGAALTGHKLWKAFQEGYSWRWIEALQLVGIPCFAPSLIYSTQEYEICQDIQLS